MGCGCSGKQQGVDTPSLPNNQIIQTQNELIQNEKNEFKKCNVDPTNKNLLTQGNAENINPEQEEQNRLIKKENQAIDEEMIIVSQFKSKSGERKKSQLDNNKVAKKDYQYESGKQKKQDVVIKPEQKRQEKDMMMESVCSKINIQKLDWPLNESQINSRLNKQHQRRQSFDILASNLNNTNPQSQVLERSITKKLDITKISWKNQKKQQASNFQKKKQQSKQNQNEICHITSSQQIIKQQSQLDKQKSEQEAQDIIHSPTKKIDVSKLEWPKREDQQQDVDVLNIQRWQLKSRTKIVYQSRNEKQNNDSKNKWVRDKDNEDGQNKFIKEGRYEAPSNFEVRGYEIQQGQSRVNVVTLPKNFVDSQLVKTKVNQRSSVLSSKNQPREVSTIAETIVRRR